MVILNQFRLHFVSDIPIGSSRFELHSEDFDSMDPVVAFEFAVTLRLESMQLEVPPPFGSHFVANYALAVGVSVWASNEVHRNSAIPGAH